MSQTNESKTEPAAKERPAHKAEFATLDDGKKVTPPSDSFRVFLVTSPTGKQSYTWAQTADTSITNAARADGY
jgi:hypothetical protein